MEFGEATKTRKICQVWKCNTQPWSLDIISEAIFTVSRRPAIAQATASLLGFQTLINLSALQSLSKGLSRTNEPSRGD